MTEPPRPPPSERSDPEVAPEPTPAPAPAPSTEASAAGTPPPAAPPPVAPFVYGNVFWVDADDTDDAEGGPHILVVERARAPRPPSEPIGFAMVHVGSWELRPIADETTPYTTASVITNDGVCEARVVRARHLYASMADPDDESLTLETSYLGLDLEGCERGSFAVAGVPITAHRLDWRQAPPARPELTAAIASHDAELADFVSMPPGVLRAFELPERELAVVFARDNWGVHRGELVLERFGGAPEVVIEAGAHTLFVMQSPSEGWMASLEDFAPPRPDGTPRRLCTVEDPAGTPLNVRSTPSSGGEVLRTVTNGTRVEVIDDRGGWRRIEGAPAGWVFGDALRCR